MTPEQRVERLVEYGTVGPQHAALDLAAVREAVAEERAACARLAESMDDGKTYDFPPPRDVAAAIRARG
jgi:hypothetical protein